MQSTNEKLVTDVNIWNQMGDNYWTNRSQRQRWAHNYVLYPELYRLLEGCEYNSILDYGCGDGSFCKYLLNNNIAGMLHAYDPCDSMANLAANNIGAEHVMNNVGDTIYDIIILNLVFQDVDNPNETLEALNKVLSPTGSIILSIPHPVFALIESRHLTTKREFSKNSKKGIYRYFEEDKEFVYWDESMEVKSVIHNRTTATYINYFKKSGFVVAELTEPRPIVSGEIEADLYAMYNELPSFMIFRIEKNISLAN